MLWLRIRKTLDDGTVPRLVSAFLCGLLLGFLSQKVGSGMQNIVPFLLFPLLVGAAAAPTIGVRNPRPYLMTLCTGLLCWTGIVCYLLIAQAGTPSAACSAGNCEPATVLKTLLVVYLLAGFLPVALSSLAACVAMRYLRRNRGPEFP